MRTLILATLLAVAGTAAAVVAAEPSPAAIRSEAIAPFVDQGTVAIGRVDVTKIDLQQLVEKATKLFPEEADGLQAAMQRLTLLLAAFTKAGGREVYLVVTLTDLRTDPQFLVVPLVKEADVEALTAVLNGIGLGSCKRMSQSLVVASETMHERLATLQPDARPDLVAAFQAAGDGLAQALLLPPKHTRRVMVELMPTLPKEIGGGSSTVVTQGVLWAALGIVGPPEMSIRLTIQSQDHEAAAALRARTVEWLALAGKQPPVRQALPNFDDVAKLLTPEVQGDRVSLVLRETNDTIRTIINAAAIPLAKARQQARRSQSANNLKQIALAMHMYHDAQKHFPAAALYSPDGKPLLSWRVQLLPYLGQEALYKEFHLDEPWDSRHNRTLIDRMPAIFRSPLSEATSKTATTYLVPVGKETVFPGKEPVSIKDITDGTSSTIMLVEADDDHAVTWTRPDDLTLDLQQPALGLPKEGFNAAMCDGAVHQFKLPRDPKDLRGLFTRAGGEVVSP